MASVQAKVGSGVVASLLLASRASVPAGHAQAVFVDPRDGQSYPIVTIGKQDWLARDLSYDASSPPNGRLYRWQLATIVCPAGWHLPDESEWQALEVHLGMPVSELEQEGMRGADRGAQLRRGGASGFDAPLSGYRRPDGSYVRFGERSAYWLSAQASDTAAWHRDIRADDGRIYRSSVPMDYALSVRCLRDATRVAAPRTEASQSRGVVRDSKIARGIR